MRWNSRFLRLALFVVATSSLALSISGGARPASAQEGAAPAPAATGESAPTAGDGHQKQNMLMWIIETSGWIGAVIFLLSVYFVAAVTRSFLELRPRAVLPDDVVDDCESLIAAKDFTALYKRVKDDDSFFATVLTAGLTELRHGLDEARDAMERVAEAGTIELERRISMLAVLGTLGPMIGLLGTLKGMIASFSVIAMSDTALKPSEVAGGISEALVLTFEGVLLSVPAIYFFALFRNRINALTSDASLAADLMIRRLNNLVKGKAGPAAPEGTVPPGAAVV